MNFKFPVKKLMFVFMMASIVSLIAPVSSSFASLDFNSEINLSSSNDLSQIVRIAEDGNIYVIWKEGTDVFFKRSTDNGDTFEGSQNLSNSGGVISLNHQIAASGSNVSVVWDEGGEIKIKSSADSGSSFGSISNLSNNIAASESPQVAMSGSNIFVVWVDYTDGFLDPDIYFTKSTGPSNPFDAPQNLSAAQDKESIGAQIAADGSDVFVVWSDDTPNGFFSDILLTASSSSGTSFGTEINLSSTSTQSTKPQIAASGNNVHVVWSDPTIDNPDVIIASSTNNGVSFNSSINLSNNVTPSEGPQISASGNNVHVVWKDGIGSDGEIFYVKSTNSGSTYSSAINLSENDGLSEKPQVSISGTNVYVIWKDSSFGTDPETNILLRSSSDGGSNFASFQHVSENTEISTDPELVSSGTDVFIVWKEGKFPDPGDVFFRTGSVSSNIINFDSSQYAIGQSPTLTVTDSSAVNANPNETKSAVITSDSDGVGISITLTENADTGVFTNSFTLTADSSSNPSKNLHGEPNDVITATVGSTTGSASILPIEIEFDFEDYDYGDVAHITVTDKASNTDPSISETVSVTVTSGVDSIGINLILTETGPNTGIFSGNSALGNDDTDLIFMSDNYYVSISGTLTVSSTDEKSNVDPNVVDTINVKVTSKSDTTGIQLILSETDIDTGDFEGILSFSSISSNANTGTILVDEGDFFKVIDPTAEFASNGMVLPNFDLSNGAISVAGFPGGATATATYKSVTDTASIFDQGASGGGGGGLVRPSLVVNALAGIAGGGSAYSSPTLHLSNLVRLGQIDVPLEVEQMIFNHDSSVPISPMALGLFEDFSYPLTINDQGFILIDFSNTLETQTLQTNTPHTIKFMYYESDKIQHFSLYTNLRDTNTAIHQSDTQILYNDGQEIQIVDPNGFFEDVSFTLNEIDDLKKEIVLEITFASPMDTTDIMVRSWDPQLNSFDTQILDAFEVVPGNNSGESPIITYEEPIIEELESQSIPVWIKNNAEWWSDQQIGDSDFVSGIEYLIKNEIINVPGVEVGTNSASTEIPDWIKNNAGWWAESLITDDDFIEAMQWLIGNGVIQI